MGLHIFNTIIFFLFFFFSKTVARIFFFIFIWTIFKAVSSRKEAHSAREVILRDVNTLSWNKFYNLFLSMLIRDFCSISESIFRTMLLSIWLVLFAAKEKAQAILNGLMQLLKQRTFKKKLQAVFEAKQPKSSDIIPLTMSVWKTLNSFEILKFQNNLILMMAVSMFFSVFLSCSWFPGPHGAPDTLPAPTVSTSLIGTGLCPTEQLLSPPDPFLEAFACCGTLGISVSAEKRSSCYFF